MRFRAKQIIGKRVRTKSGQELGWVSDFELDGDTGVVSKFIVAPEKIFIKLWGELLVIDRSQVLTINETEMIVGDNLVPGDVRVAKVPAV